ncbi:MAG: YajQ family cyclic di-GMP-binding protein [Candidatus Nanopelagicales bacterium]|nr:YajQ family cyclic di-GMP-binding protein [Candidatus Nanopelagicales bacterium]
MADSSFDVVSKVDRQEADNALNQCSKELRQRFDFRNTGASVEWAGDLSILLRASTEERVLAALDVFKEKLIKRGVSLKSLEADDPKPSGKEHRITATFQSGLTSEQARSISKIIREEGPKAVKIQIQGDEVRVSGKKRDDLQAVISLIKEKDLDFAVQFTNYR